MNRGHEIADATEAAVEKLPGTMEVTAHLEPLGINDERLDERVGPSSVEEVPVDGAAGTRLKASIRTRLIQLATAQQPSQSCASALPSASATVLRWRRGEAIVRA